MTVAGAAQVAAAHCPNERTLELNSQPADQSFFSELHNQLDSLDQIRS